MINRVEADLAHSGNSPAAPETAGEVARHPEDNVAASKPIVEVAHEALFTCWHRLKDWISDARKVLFVKNRLANDCRRWKLVLKSDAAGANDELWRGSRLQEALNLRAGNLFEIVVERLSEDENRFLDRSYELRDKAEWEKMEQKRKQRELEEMAYERATALRSGELAKKHLEELRMYMKREIEHAIKSDELAQKLREERMWRQLNF